MEYRTDVTAQDRTYDICIVGGAGHVGAPLAIVLASRGMRTLAYDINTAAIHRLSQGFMPFFEEGAEPLLASVLSKRTLEFTSSPDNVGRAPVVVLTIGTPIDEYH